jgi:predicted HD superfamily hydrolase involved in NAD metabolism
MKIEEAQSTIREMLPDKRYRHSLGVSETAGKLAARFGADVDKARLAGMLHDIVKYFPDKKLKQLIEQHPNISNEYLSYSNNLWHAPAGAAYVEQTLGVKDRDILNAIIYHTTGKKDMTRLEKIIFLADYIEPGRDFPGVEDVRKAAENSLDEAVFEELLRTITHLLDQHQRVYPDTFFAYNDLVGSQNNQ